jgi:Fic family protein
MKKIEKAPDWKNEELLSKGIKLIANDYFKAVINKINDKYLYWDKVKHQDIIGKADNKALWSAVKFSRSLNAKEINFGSYKFSYNLTGFIQKSLHEFDLNIGGQSESRGLIPENEKKKYLISSIMEEAIASSQIEGAVTTRKKAKEMLRKSIKPKTKSDRMILNNYLTIKYIVDIQNETLTGEKLFEIHKLITDRTMDEPEYEGRYRDNNEINVIDASDGELVYHPPAYSVVPELMDELFEFFNKQKKDQFIHPVIKACIIHFMIGFIHPFADGNGRTARALFYWYLLKNGYRLTEYLSISRLIIKSRVQYAQAFRYTENDENDLSYFITYKLKTLNSAFESLKEYVQRKISEKRNIIHFQKMKGVNDRQAQILKRIYDEPDILLTVKEIENSFSVSNQTARNDLTGLAAAGYLELVEINGKTKAFCKGEKFEELLK